MKKQRIFLIAAGLWLLFIWGNSLVPAKKSAQVSTQITHTVAPELKGDAVFIKTGEIRDFAHLAEFGLLGLLLTAGITAGKRFWNRAAVTGALCMAAALLDETFQLLAAGRTARIEDIWQDLLGALIGIVAVELLCFAISLLQKRRQNSSC